MSEAKKKIKIEQVAYLPLTAEPTRPTREAAAETGGCGKHRVTNPKMGDPDVGGKPKRTAAQRQQYREKRRRGESGAEQVT